MENFTQQPSFTVKLRRIGCDVIAATTAAFLVAPLVSTVDRAIIENTSGVATFMQSAGRSLKLLVTRPHRFLGTPQFLMVWGVYSGTYIAANIIESTCEWLGRSSQWPKFIGVGATNAGLGIAKDRAFARMYGAHAPSAFPLLSIGLFAMRDASTIAASFNLPRYLAEFMFSAGAFPTKRQAEDAAQLISPVAIQLASVPLHLYALDLYNRKSATVPERMRLVADKYVVTVGGRCARILPAFGIGGVTNRYLRERLIE